MDIDNSNRRGVLKEYARHPRIMERFPAGFKVALGFGLHFGWAIEGVLPPLCVCVCLTSCEWKMPLPGRCKCREQSIHARCGLPAFSGQGRNL